MPVDTVFIRRCTRAAGRPASGGLLCSPVRRQSILLFHEQVALLMGEQSEWVNASSVLHVQPQLFTDSIKSRANPTDNLSFR